MSYLNQADRQAPRKPTVCISNAGNLFIQFPDFSFIVIPLGGGSPPFLRQSFLFNLSIPQLPPGKIGPLTATWINAFGPASFSGPGNFNGYLGPTNDAVVGLTLSFPDGSVWGTAYATPPGHPHQPKGG